MAGPEPEWLNLACMYTCSKVNILMCRNHLRAVSCDPLYRASDRMQKEITNYIEIWEHITWKIWSIMQLKLQIMR